MLVKLEMPPPPPQYFTGYSWRMPRTVARVALIPGTRQLGLEKSGGRRAPSARPQWQNNRTPLPAFSNHIPLLGDNQPLDMFSRSPPPRLKPPTTIAKSMDFTSLKPP